MATKYSRNNSGVYRITNIVNDKIYIGSSGNMKYRWKGHLSALKSQTHKNKHLQRAYNKYGETAFIFEILEECAFEKLFEREQYWIDASNCTDIKIGYNICKITGSIMKNMKHSDETKKKLSDSWSLKIANGYKRNYAPASEETKRKVSLANKNRPIHPNTKREFLKSISRPVNVYKDGELFAEYSNTKEAAKELKIDRDNLYSHLRGERDSINGYVIIRTNNLPVRKKNDTSINAIIMACSKPILILKGNIKIMMFSSASNADKAFGFAKGYFSGVLCGHKTNTKLPDYTFIKLEDFKNVN